ncbi:MULTISPECIES: CYTH domain-containing protein [unclassified Granulicatella]|uniref:CYTH domain-containing protein n=1 Tax=unclassified Granulicatella TaxID=2630493 RepID=UPI0010745829|nr:MULTISPECIES: CYTH domain-containing protein [unclassified Granulicatella]MBF0779606.1 CYTH domain-containing protein [Granulicatella sp. 19428wC4_WM01]TFU96405.1 CYTH domain-containing protein [Granulicatella sp. WM01]
MGTLIEKEIRTGLSEQDYHKLYQVFECQNRKKIMQENYYFDTKDFDLRHHQLGLRIRLDDIQAEYTLKEPLSDKQKLETTDILSLDDAKEHLTHGTFPKKHVSQKLDQYHIYDTDLCQIGSLKNERYEINTLQGLWVLDKSHFPNGISYELEFEYIHSTKPFFDFLETHAIPFQDIPTKLARAVSKL